MEEQTNAEQIHQHFIKTVAQTSIVYSLYSAKEGYATSRANEYEDEEGDSLEVICFWSTEAATAACAVNAWKNYKPQAIPLAEFMESWCVSMYQEDVIVGIDFDTDLLGYEAEPLVLVNQLIEGLKQTGSAIKFVNYTSLDDFSACLNEAME